MHDSEFVANEFLEKAADMGKTFTPMQLLKLVYIAHGWMLGLYGEPLIRDPVEAWKYGPVIPRLYHAVKRWGGDPIIGKLAVSNDDDLADVEKDLIDQVIRLYGDHSGIALSNLTHQAGTPWDRVYREDISSQTIPNDIVQAHYKALVA